ncbi:MAG: DNA-3-methyladenine glycosylase [Clostridia bacterium]|nr:DNA-3-methyladenine glycosylase [Clostridia bacterium]
MKVYEKNSSVFLENAENFNIKQIFECGQCFRFHAYDSDYFEGVAFGKYLGISQIGNLAVIHNCTLDEFNTVWKGFFDFDTNYGKISSSLAKDDIMKKAISFGGGIRILKQDMFECIVSFIISQNNSIYNIERVVERISEKYGTPIGIYNGKLRYAFPTPQQLSKATAEELTALKCGYRAEYITGFTKAVANGEFDIESLDKMPADEAKEKLMAFKGIGNKVADCILLFGYHKFDVFPTDVWVKKAMADLYAVDVKNINAFSNEYFGKYRGLAQQYLFYYKRSGKN